MPRQAIETKYIGASNTRSSRVKATSGSGKSVTVPWDYDLGVYENHEAAAYALCKRLGWDGNLIGGGLKHGYVFVFNE